MLSTRTGQGSLRPLPPPNATTPASLASYDTPADLKAERKSLSGSKAGIEVYKVAKVCLHMLGDVCVCLFVCACVFAK